MRDCPACKSNEKHIIFRNQLEIPSKGAFHSGYDVVECECGMVYADKLPSHAAFAEYYGQQAKKARHFTEKEPIWYQRIHEDTAGWLCNHVGLRNKRILEAGCFTGDLMLKIGEYGPKEISGYDPSESGIAIARKNGLNAWVSDSYGYNYGDYDLLVLSHVLEHIVDIKPFIADVGCALKPDGVLFIEVPDVDNFVLYDSPSMMIDQRQPMLQFSLEHINYFSRSSLVRMMDKLGFDFIEVAQCTSGVMVLRGLFHKRVSSGEVIEQYLFDSISRMKDAMANIAPGEYYWWGVGGYTQQLLGNVPLPDGVRIEAFIDNEQAYAGGEMLGRPVIMPHKADKPLPVIIASQMYGREIEQQIANMREIFPGKVIRL